VNPTDLARSALYAATILPVAFLVGTLLLGGTWRLHRGSGWGSVCVAMGIINAAFWVAVSVAFALPSDPADDRYLAESAALVVSVDALVVVPFTFVALVAWAWERQSERRWAQAARDGHELRS
jgi:hypothetical protein